LEQSWFKRYGWEKEGKVKGIEEEVNMQRKGETKSVNRVSYVSVHVCVCMHI